MSDPFEGWAIVESHPAYEVSDQGHVRRGGRILKPQKVPGGYLAAQLWRGGRPSRRLIHRLVAAAFIGPCPPGREVNHKDGNKHHNAVANLEYLTRPDNMRHAYRTGLRQVTVMQAAAKRRKPRTTAACACGCGAFLETPDKKGRPRQFISGHNVRKAS